MATLDFLDTLDMVIKEDILDTGNFGHFKHFGQGGHFGQGV